MRKISDNIYNILGTFYHTDYRELLNIQFTLINYNFDMFKSKYNLKITLVAEILDQVKAAEINTVSPFPLLGTCKERCCEGINVTGET